MSSSKMPVSMSSKLASISVLATLLAGVTGQGCGTQNSASDCEIYALPVQYSTVYFAPDDCLDISFYDAYSNGCTSGSSAEISLYSGTIASGGNFITDCGCLPLDGNTYNINCNGTARNSLPDGSFYFQVGGIAFDPFTVTHSQQTDTAPTPTSTVSPLRRRCMEHKLILAKYSRQLRTPPRPKS